ncbi:MAG TPA: ABC transporter permease, partial [Oribacterium sp.]|nr:ABC transporter permease [Oribacterium sp.]
MTLLRLFGIQQKMSFLGNPKTALGVIVLMGVWQFGS